MKGVHIIVAYYVLCEYCNWIDFCQNRVLMPAMSKYHPLILLLVGRLMARVNRRVMSLLGFVSHGNGVYVSRNSADTSEETTLVIGGFLSANLSCTYIGNLLRLVRTPTVRMRYIIYNPPEACYGQWYNRELLSNGRAIRDFVTMMIDRIRPFVTSMHDLHIVGHSYGTILASRFRIRYPANESARTWMFDPVIYSRNEMKQLYNITSATVPFNTSVPGKNVRYWRQVILLYILQYPHFCRIGQQATLDLSATISDTDGDVVFVLGTHDDLINQDTIKDTRKHIVVVPGAVHGMSIFTRLIG